MSFNTSLSGINAASTDLSITANNIANASTVGFKESRGEFATMIQASNGTTGNSAGAGTKTAQITQQFTQGAINNTGRSLDLAISGEGFFALSLDGMPMYSRAGSFHTDAQGYVINAQGARLQVFAPSADGNGFDKGGLTDLRIVNSDGPPKATTNVDLSFTLPAQASEPAATPFDPANTHSYNITSGGVTVYDSLGISHTQTSYFVKTANPNEWTVHNYVDGVAAGTPVNIQFNANGELITPADGMIDIQFASTNGSAPLAMSLNINGSSQYGQNFSLTNTSQDGYTSGKLNEIAISEEGIVTARYNNGAELPVGQLALANFNNPQGLIPNGDNGWSESGTSGLARIGTPGSSDFGQLQSGALEGSTVDLTAQLVNMILAQRNFQASAQMISTQNETTQTIINIR